MKDLLKLILISIIIFSQIESGQCKWKNQNNPPNVLLILTDNQSYYELSCNGHNIVRTPNIDKFADEGVVFDNFFASPFCSPSRSEILTGRYALKSGIHNTIGGVSLLSKNQTLLTDLLREAGYKNAIFGKWHLGNEYPYNPLYRGFDKSFIHDGGGIGQLPDYYSNTHINAYYNDNGNIVPSCGFSTDVLFSKAELFIKQNKDNPFFCFISPPATHSPWQAHPEKLIELEKRGVNGSDNEMALYSMIENIDDNVGVILNFLDSLRLREKTFVIIATDQGMRYRGLDKSPPEINFGLPDHVFDNRHRVFCMMQCPEIIKSTGKVTFLTGIIDITPTILDITGLPVPSNMDGKSLKPILTGNVKDWDKERTMIIQCPRERERIKNQNVSVKTNKWRLINGSLLFDAENDPYQLKDISDSYPLVVDSLNKIYNDFWKSLPPVTEIFPVRQFLWAPDSSEIRLNAMDWYIDDSPWTQNQIDKKDHQGIWAVDVNKTGKYRFELRRFPREASNPVGADDAAVQIGNLKVRTAMQRSDEKAVLEIELKKGKYDLQTFFEEKTDTGDKIKEWGAYFVYIKYL